MPINKRTPPWRRRSPSPFRLLLLSAVGVILWGMPKQRSNLSSYPPTVTGAGPNSISGQRRHLLPKDLAGALKWLDDVEFDALLAAVITEAQRRGRRRPSPAKEKQLAVKSQRRQAAEDDAPSLTTGKLNAVRAAFRAGIKPSAIARQFGLSQSDVRYALAQGRRREA